MTLTSFLYGNVYTKAFNKEINWSTDTIKIMLCTSTYVPNQDTHIYKSDVTNEVVGTGYIAGGATLASKTATYTPATNVLAFDAADAIWASSIITARYAVIYDDTTVATTSPLIGYVDFGADQISSNGNFTITWDAAGIFKVTVS